MVDDPKHSRSTRRFDSEQLAKLTGKAGGDNDAEREWGNRSFAPDSQADAVAASRTATMHDPLTMALLAEVARTSRTVEIDSDKIEGATALAETAAAEAAATEGAAAEAAAAEGAATEPHAHPRIKRR